MPNGIPNFDVENYTAKFKTVVEGGPAIWSLVFVTQISSAHNSNISSARQ